MGSRPCLHVDKCIYLGGRERENLHGLLLLMLMLLLVLVLVELVEHACSLRSWS